MSRSPAAWIAGLIHAVLQHLAYLPHLSAANLVSRWLTLLTGCSCVALAVLPIAFVPFCYRQAKNK